MATEKLSSARSTPRASKTTKTTDNNKLQQQVTDLAAKCSALEKRCTSLESTVKNNSKNTGGNNVNNDHEERWQQLRKFLVNKFGMEQVKRSQLLRLGTRLLQSLRLKLL